jgi:RNA polymerase sigma-70 factor (ECF subfamily)
MTDEKLIDVLNTDSKIGLEQLMNDYIGLVYTIAYSKLHTVCTKEDIEELVSDIFFEFYRGINSLEASKGSVKGCLSVLAKRRSIDAFRKSRNRKYILLDDESFSDDIAGNENVEQNLLRNESNIELIKAINALGEPDSEIIIRKYYFEQSNKQIAEELKIKSNTVAKKASRGLNKLRYIIEEKEML